MKNNLSAPKRVEVIFNTLYLLTAAVLGLILLFHNGQDVVKLWGIMALILAVGDAFHLIPRIAAAYTGQARRFQAAMGIGKMLTSITMTLFYVVLWQAGLLLFDLDLTSFSLILYLLAFIRIVLCLFPQNRWTSPSAEGDPLWGIYRNIPFVLQGIMVLWLFASYGSGLPAIRWLWLAILLSFLFYLPVVLWVHKKPKLGMLMLPKTCAYVWIIFMGFWLI